MNKKDFFDIVDEMESEDLKKFRDKIEVYIELFVKSRIKNNYSKLNYLIANNIMIDLGFDEINIRENIYYSREKEFDDYALKYWPNNMLELIEKVDVASKISIVIELNKQHDIAFISLCYNFKEKFNKGNILFFKSYDIENISHEKFENKIVKIYVPENFVMNLRKTIYDYDLKKLDWDEIIRNPIIFK